MSGLTSSIEEVLRQEERTAGLIGVEYVPRRHNKAAVVCRASRVSQIAAALSKYGFDIRSGFYRGAHARGMDHSARHPIEFYVKMGDFTPDRTNPSEILVAGLRDSERVAALHDGVAPVDGVTGAVSHDGAAVVATTEDGADFLRANFDARVLHSGLLDYGRVLEEFDDPSRLYDVSDD